MDFRLLKVALFFLVIFDMSWLLHGEFFIFRVKFFDLFHVQRGVLLKKRDLPLCPNFLALLIFVAFFFFCFVFGFLLFFVFLYLNCFSSISSHQGRCFRRYR